MTALIGAAASPEARPLGECISIVMGQAPAGKDCNKSGTGTPFVKAGEFGLTRPVIREWTTAPKKFAKRSDVFVCVVGATCGKINFGEECAIGRSVAALRPKPGILDQFYLHYYLQGTVDLLRRGSLGAAQTVISKAMLEELPIPLPPLDEQKRIVAVLDQAFAALDRARAHAEANLADAKEFLESYVEGQLIASGGNVSTLQELLDNGAIKSHLDGNHGSDYPRKDEFVSSGIPYISANCIVGQDIEFGRAKFLSKDRAAQLRKGIARDRDVIFAHNATVGPVALLKTQHEKVILGTSLTYYRCDSNKILPEFLVYEMRSANFRLQYEAVMKQATRNQVPITAQRKFLHTIPSLAEQRRIVEQCADIERLSQRLVEQYTAEVGDLANPSCKKPSPAN